MFNDHELSFNVEGCLDQAWVVLLVSSSIWPIPIQITLNLLQRYLMQEYLSTSLYSPVYLLLLCKLHLWYTCLLFLEKHDWNIAVAYQYWSHQWTTNRLLKPWSHEIGHLYNHWPWEIFKVISRNYLLNDTGRVYCHQSLVMLSITCIFYNALLVPLRTLISRFLYIRSVLHT